jgi:signal transduction histidine kinase
MRKIWYSNLLKVITAVVFIASITLGVLTVTGGVMAFCNEDQDLYSLERDFSEANFIPSLLSEPEYVVVNAYYQSVRQYDLYGSYIPAGRIDLTQYRDKIIENIRNGLEAMGRADDLNYYIQWNDTVFTNCGGNGPDELVQGDYYSYVKRTPGGDIERDSTHEIRSYGVEELMRFDNTSTVIISCQIKEEAIKVYKAIWERQEAVVLDTFLQTLVCATIALLLLVYLVCVCGKNKDGEYRNLWIDRIWLEIHLTVVAGIGIGGAVLCVFVLDEFSHGHFPGNLVYLAAGAAGILGSTVILTSLLSVVRMIKTGKFLTSSGIFLVGKWIFQWLIKITKWIGRNVRSFWRMAMAVLSKKSGVLVLVMLFLYTVLIGIFGILTTETPTGLIFAILVFAIAGMIAVYRGNDLDEIKKAVGEVRKGNISYQIPKLKSEDLQRLAEDIHELTEGLEEAVAGKVKAERMKSELITNVSHDLKTPITSIISYTQLLSQIEDLPEEARDYVSVLAMKGERIKKLTQDLFDISKAQSGNETVLFEKLDVALLISQALGEQERDILSSGLPFCVEAPKDLYIWADGRKLSRVLNNLICNILKYTMKNTRVFITAALKGDKVEIEFKNISAYPLTFAPEEIVQRFVRGDASRTEEGNGLGLAIAKSYTELCNGSLEIRVDGDMFKVILAFPAHS